LGERVLSFQSDTPGAQRLDKLLVARLPEYSRAYIQRLIKDGYVTLGEGGTQRPAYKAGQSVEHGTAVQIYLPPPVSEDLSPESIPLDIVFEDHNLIVINKPAGMVVHPGAGHAHGTLVHAALDHAPEITGVGGEKRPGVVHRLDKDTSGLIILAKNDAAHSWLQDQFRQRRVEKIYLALVDGKPPTPLGRIEVPIGRSTRRKGLGVAVSQNGREAISEYRTLEEFPHHTLLEIHPITGRTHQIRLHLSFLGCPVVGDRIYGRKHPTIPLKRHFLHAAQLSICLLGEETLCTFRASLPGELKSVLEALRGSPSFEASSAPLIE
jgi:23S rRNA pseudouridine1911/1915/1917 synthase